MGWTILFAVLAAFAQFGNAWLGWTATHSARRPTAARRRLYNVLFGLTGVVCVGMAAYRSGRLERTFRSMKKWLVRLVQPRKQRWPKASTFIDIHGLITISTQSNFRVTRLDTEQNQSLDFPSRPKLLTRYATVKKSRKPCGQYQQPDKHQTLVRPSVETKFS